MASEFHPTYFSVSFKNPHHLCLLLTCDDNPLMYWDCTYFELIRPLCPSSLIFFSGSNHDFWKGQLIPATYQPLQSLINLFSLFRIFIWESLSRISMWKTQISRWVCYQFCRFSFYGQLSFQQISTVLPEMFRCDLIEQIRADLNILHMYDIETRE